eukprot:scaffold267788_cov31-Prasinocladus_malaysianus.AAC.4
MAKASSMHTFNNQAINGEPVVYYCRQFGIHAENYTCAGRVSVIGGAAVAAGRVTIARLDSPRAEGSKDDVTCLRRPPGSFSYQITAGANTSRQQSLAL